MVISFDIGGVLDEGADVLRPLTETLVRDGHKIIVITAIGHGRPGKWGFTEAERYKTSEARLIGKGYKQGVHWDGLFVVPDPDSGSITGRYKNYYLKMTGAEIHVDDNEAVLAEVTCRKVRFHTKMDPALFVTELFQAIRDLERSR